MLVRDYSFKDYDEIKTIHSTSEMGKEYDLPDLDDPLFVVKKVVTDDNGKIIGASFLRIEAETFLLLDENSNPRKKVEAILEMSPIVELEAWKLGLSNLKATIPDWMSAKFAKKLTKLGWIKAKEGWKSWYRLLGGK